MAEHIPKTDEEIAWKKMVHNAEVEEFQHRQSKTIFQVVCELGWELIYKSSIGIFIFVVLWFLWLRYG